jgi:hypothetical protein
MQEQNGVEKAEKAVMDYTLSGEVLQILNRPRSRYTNANGVECTSKEAQSKGADGKVVLNPGCAKVQVRYDVNVPMPKTAQGLELLYKNALGYIAVNMANEFAVFNGKVENELSLEELKALDGTTITVDLDALAPAYIAKTPSTRGPKADKFPPEVHAVFQQMRARKAALGKPMTDANGVAITVAALAASEDPRIINAIAKAKRALERQDDSLDI